MTISQEAEVSDLRKALRKNVKKKAADEFVRIDGHGSDAIVFFTVSPLETDFPVLKSHQAVIGDGDAVCITAQVIKDLNRSSKGRFGVDDPFVFAAFAQELVESSRIGQRFEFGKKL